MIHLISISVIVLALAGCRDSRSSRSPALPDNLLEDRPIVLKEGQAVVLVPEGNKSLLIGASVVDGKLTISEIDPEDRSFSVTWSDSDTWSTSTMDSAEGTTTTLIDKDGDGLPDLRAVMTQGGLSRFRLDSPTWVELGSKTDSEQAGTGQPATSSDSKSEGGDEPQPEAEGPSR